MGLQERAKTMLMTPLWLQLESSSRISLDSIVTSGSFSKGNEKQRFFKILCQICQSHKNMQEAMVMWIEMLVKIKERLMNPSTTVTSVSGDHHTLARKKHKHHLTMITRNYLESHDGQLSNTSSGVKKAVSWTQQGKGDLKKCEQAKCYSVIFEQKIILQSCKLIPPELGSRSGLQNNIIHNQFCMKHLLCW